MEWHTDSGLCHEGNRDGSGPTTDALQPTMQEGHDMYTHNPHKQRHVRSTKAMQAAVQRPREVRPNDREVRATAASKLRWPYFGVCGAADECGIIIAILARGMGAVQYHRLLR